MTVRRLGKGAVRGRPLDVRARLDHVCRTRPFAARRHVVVKARRRGVDDRHHFRAAEYAVEMVDLKASLATWSPSGTRSGKATQPGRG